MAAADMPQRGEQIGEYGWGGSTHLRAKGRPPKWGRPTFFVVTLVLSDDGEMAFETNN